jgi:hypothetical protein
MQCIIQNGSKDAAPRGKRSFPVFGFLRRQKQRCDEQSRVPWKNGASVDHGLIHPLLAKTPDISPTGSLRLPRPLKTRTNTLDRIDLISVRNTCNVSKFPLEGEVGNILAGAAAHDTANKPQKKINDKKN